MGKLTKSQRKEVNKKLSEKEFDDNSSLTLQQQNVYHMGASEMEALHHMQDEHPALVDKIMSLRQQELDTQKDIVTLEANEQAMRKKEAPYIRRYAFRGQIMAYSLGVFSLLGAAYFGYHGENSIAIGFLTSTVGIAFAQFFNPKPSKKTEEQ